MYFAGNMEGHISHNETPASTPPKIKSPRHFRMVSKICDLEYLAILVTSISPFELRVFKE